MSVVRVVLGKSGPAKFYNKQGKRISVDTAFGMYQKKSRFVVGGKTLNVNRFGAGELSECPVCLEDKVLVKPYKCKQTPHGVCIDCANRIVTTTNRCPMCRAKPLHPALFWAAFHGKHELVADLAKKGAIIDLVNEKGNTPVKIATWMGHHKVVRALIDAGANVDLAGMTDGKTPLLEAAEKGHHEIVTALLNAGAMVDLANNDGSTPVLLASRMNHHETVRVLADKGANLDLANVWGETPLLVAAWKGHTKVMHILRLQGANWVTMKADMDSIHAELASAVPQRLSLLLTALNE